MNTNTNSVGSAPAMPTAQHNRESKVGINLHQLLDITCGNTDKSEMKTDAERELYDQLAPRYNPVQMRVTIEEQALYRSLEPHLVDINRAIPEPIPLLSRYGSTIASEGNISAVVGAAKSKKTFLCTALVGALLRTSQGSMFGITPKDIKVLWVDTEQSASHVQRVVKRIYSLAGWNSEINYSNLRTLTLREIEPKERAEKMADAIKLFKPKLIVIDGISDLMYNSNCIEESDAVVGQLMALSTEYNCHILCVLHTNPNSDKARGHIGSTLQRKAETMIYVHKIGDCSVVEPQFCRNEEFSPFAFCITEEGLPEECEIPRISEKENSCVAIMRNFFPNGVERTVLVTKIEEELGISNSNAKVKVSRAIKSGILELQGNGNVVVIPATESPPTTYGSITEGRCSVV